MDLAWATRASRRVCVRACVRLPLARSLAPLAARMGKKGKKRQDDDDFEAAVQSLAIEDDQPAKAAAASEVDELLEKALAGGLLTESEFDAITDQLAEGALTEASLLAEWRPRLQEYEASNAAAAEPAAPPPRRAAAPKPVRSQEELAALSKAVGADGLVLGDALLQLVAKLVHALRLRAQGRDVRALRE